MKKLIQRVKDLEQANSDAKTANDKALSELTAKFEQALKDQATAYDKRLAAIDEQVFEPAV